MGLYDEAGKLNYVGRCGVGDSSHEIAKLLKPLIGGSGFTGNAPGGLSRWSGRENKPIPLEPRLVAEVSADHIENGRFLHGSRLIRWRDDKEPRACRSADSKGGLAFWDRLGTTSPVPSPSCNPKIGGGVRVLHEGGRNGQEKGSARQG